MTKAELVDALVKDEKFGLTKKTAGEVVDLLFDTMAKAIRQEKRFAFPGFGTFTVRKREERRGRNPQTGEQLVIPASHTVAFKPAPELKKSLE